MIKSKKIIFAAILFICSFFNTVSARENIVINKKNICSCFKKIDRTYNCSTASSFSSIRKNITINRDSSNSISVNYLNYIASKNLKNNNLEAALKVRQDISKLYACMGYINSGAILKQHEKGITIYDIIEGRLAKKNILLKGNNHLKSNYLKRAIIGKKDNVVLDYNKIRSNLEILRKNPLIRSIKATLQPISTGVASLKVKVVENKPYHVKIKVNNYQSKSLGKNQLILETAYFPNWLTQDQIYVKASLSEKEGSKNFDVGYRWHLNDKGIAFLNIGKKKSIVVSPPFDNLEIESDTTTASVTYSYKLLNNYSSEYTSDNKQSNRYLTKYITTKLELLDTKNTLLGRPFSFNSGEKNGKSRVSSLVIQYQSNAASREKATSWNVGLDIGLNLFGATVNKRDIADSKYVSLVGQVQYKTLLSAQSFLNGTQLNLTLNGTLTKDRMLSSKKFTFGGAQTVRGLDQNLISRDSGLIASAELSIPLSNWNISNDASPTSGKITFTPFIEYGIAKNSHSSNARVSAATAGAGIKWKINKRLKIESYWGKSIYTQGFTEQQKNSVNKGKFYLQTSYTWGGSN